MIVFLQVILIVFMWPYDEEGHQLPAAQSWIIVKKMEQKDGGNKSIVNVYSN